MTSTEAIAVLTPILEDARRKRDDRGNRFSEVEFAHFHPSMQQYHRDRHKHAVDLAAALELAIVHLQNARSASET